MPPAPRANTTLRFHGKGTRLDLKNAWQNCRELSDVIAHTFVFEPRDSHDSDSGEAWGTLSFSTRRNMESARAQSTGNPHCGVSDSFYGLTVLQSPDDAKIDICAVHGLNGHAFETWNCRPEAQPKRKRWPRKTLDRRITPAQRSTMWLSDLLATDMKDARVMTFGYNSNLVERNITTTLEGYGRDLLEAIQENRELSSTDTTRPIIFVAYSLGGLVLRMAMPILHRDGSHNYTRIGLPGCGIVFLGTPSRGSESAAWSSLWSPLAEAGGVRRDLVHDMQPFSTRMDQNETNWTEGRDRLMDACPFKCLVEQRDTKTPGGMRRIVTKASARFLHEPADGVPETDHHSLCAFSHAGETSYGMIIERLGSVRLAILEKSRNESGGPRRSTVPGQVQINGFPDSLPYGIQCGARLDTSSHYSKPQELSKLEYTLGRADKRAVIIAGAGGVGKTEAIYQVASTFRQRAFVFLVDVEEPLDTRYIALAENLGAPLLRNLNEYSNLTRKDRRHKWTVMSIHGRAHMFRQWLEREPDGRVLFIIDDIDSSAHYRRAVADLPNNPWLPRKNVVFTTRNPSIREVLDDSTLIDIPRLPTDRCLHLAESLLNKRYERFQFTNIDSANRLIQALGDNPRAVSLAIDYIGKNLPGRNIANFTERYEGNDHRLRKNFLNHSSGLSQSMMATYEESINRIDCQEDEKDLIRVLMAVLSIMQHSESASPDEFFNLVTTAAPTRNVVASSMQHLFELTDFERGALYEKLRNVSLMTADDTIQKPWVDCSLHHIGVSKFGLIKDVLDPLSLRTYERVEPFIRACKAVLARYPIPD